METPFLGVLSRRTRIATNARAIVDAANGKEVLFFPARFDHHLVQTGDGYAAYISGALGVSTDANAEWWGSRGMGTVPHALIAAYAGDTVLATKKFAEYIDASVNVISLVDFDNDCVRTSLAVARALGTRLWGVRLDTSGTLVDASVIPQMGTFPPTGVNPQLVHNVRNALDAEGFTHVKIVASGGFNPSRISAFERDRVPVDGGVLEGESAVDEAMLTGESVPVDKKTGGEVYAGTVNLNGRLVVRVTATGEGTALARVIAAVQRAQTA